LTTHHGDTIIVRESGATTTDAATFDPPPQQLRSKNFFINERIVDYKESGEKITP